MRYHHIAINLRELNTKKRAYITISSFFIPLFASSKIPHLWKFYFMKFQIIDVSLMGYEYMGYYVFLYWGGFEI